MSENPRQSYSRPRLVYFAQFMFSPSTDSTHLNTIQHLTKVKQTPDNIPYSLQTIIPFGTNRHLSKAWKNMRLKAELNVNVALLLQLQVFTPFTRARLSNLWVFSSISFYASSLILIITLLLCNTSNEKPNCFSYILFYAAEPFGM